MVLGRADRKPSAHRVSNQVRALTSEVIDHGDELAGPLLLAVELGIRRLVALSMAQRIDAGDAETVGQCIDNPSLFPALGIQEQAVLQDDKRAGTLDGVVDTQPPMGDKRHSGDLKSSHAQREGAAACRRPRLSRTRAGHAASWVPWVWNIATASRSIPNATQPVWAASPLMSAMSQVVPKCSR